MDKLFVYGSLNNDQYFHILTGRTFSAQPAELLDHRRVQRRNSFAFALPWNGSRISGKLLSGVTPAALQKLDEYEGEGHLYHRRIARVKIDGEITQAYVYVGDPKALKPYLKKGFNDRDRIEEFVARQVERYLENKADRNLLMDRRHLSLMVTRELLSEEVESLLSQHFLDAGLPPFIIKHEIESASLPSLDWLAADRKAQAYADAYLSMVIKFIVFNQLEEKFRDQYRGSVQTKPNYYHHTLSGLMALQLLQTQRPRVQTAMTQMGVDTYREDLRYIDYGVAAIMIAEEIFDLDLADEIVYQVKKHRRSGSHPLGAELEFSNLGVQAIAAAERQDPVYDGFYYFYDFDLMRRGWKLGAHIDDHGFLTSPDVRTRGFMELAFGRYRLLGDVSKPATDDTWVLSRMIELAVDYIDVQPHSLHISIETLPDRAFRKIDDPQFFLCLLLLGGDLRKDDQGRLREWRIHKEEITHPEVGVCLSRLNRHHQNPSERKWSSVVEFQFPRLTAGRDYQPLIMALKGFQIAANPYPFKGVKECPFQALYEEIEQSLVDWAAQPMPVSASSLNAFIDLVEKGLKEEALKCGAEYDAYCRLMLGRIETELQEINQRIIDHQPKRTSTHA